MSASTLEDFRRETRAWLEAHCPPAMRSPLNEKEVVWGGRNATFPNDDARLWLERMGERGEGRRGGRRQR